MNAQKSYHKLNQILPSHRNCLYYIEYASVHCFDDTLCFQVSDKGKSKEISIPYRNIAGLLLGPGTSITQKAAQKLRESNLCAMFVTGDGGSPVLWSAPDEYRPSEYCRAFFKLFYDADLKYSAAQLLMKKRIELVRKYWPTFINDNDVIEELNRTCDEFIIRVNHKTGQDLLLEEARYTKVLYKLAARAFKMSWVSRQHTGSLDEANSMLNHGNYLAYGVANIGLYILGIPYSLSLIHGSTRRGALVFDVADIFKDALILPMAFMAASEGSSEKEFRSQVLGKFDQVKILALVLNTLKECADLSEIPLDIQDLPY